MQIFFLTTVSVDIHARGRRLLAAGHGRRKAPSKRLLHTEYGRDLRGPVRSGAHYQTALAQHTQVRENNLIQSATLYNEGCILLIGHWRRISCSFR